MSPPPPAPALSSAQRLRPRRRLLLWGAMLGLLLLALSMLVVLTARQEAGRAQEQVDAVATDAAAQVRSQLLRAQQGLQALSTHVPDTQRWQADATELLRQNRELLRIERRSAEWQIGHSVDSPFAPPLFSALARSQIDIDAVDACAAARRASAPTFSRSYFVPLAGGAGLEVLDLCMPVLSGGHDDGWQIATVALPALLAAALTPEQARRHEASFVEGDGARLARVGRAARPRRVPRGEPGRPARHDAAAAHRQRGRAAEPDPQPGDGAGAGPVVAAVRAGAAAGARRRPARTRRRRTGRGAGLPQGDGGFADHRPARARPAGPHHLRQPGLLRDGRLFADELREAPVPPYWPPELADTYRQQPAHPAGTRRRRARRVARGLRDAVHAQERRALRGHDLRGAAGRRAGAAHRLDERGAGHQRTAPRRGAVAPAAGAAAGQRAAGHRRRDGLAAEPRAEPAAGGHRQLCQRLAEPDGHARRGNARAAAPGDAAHRRAGRARRPRHQERARLRAPPRTAARGPRRGPAARRRAAAGAAAGAQERHAGRDRLAAAAAARAVRPHHGRAGAAEPGAQRHPGDGVGHRRGRARAAHPRAPDARALGHLLRRRRRPGHRPRTGGAAVHALLHHAQRRHGPGPEPVPHRRRAAWRRDGFRFAGAGHARGYRIQVHAAGDCAARSR